MFTESYSFKCNYFLALSVQKAAIPLLIEGRDVFVKSKTGTGKVL